MIVALLIPTIICSIGMIIYVVKNHLEVTPLEVKLFYPLLLFNIISGAMVTINVICIIIIAWIMEKSHRAVRRFPPRSTWNSFSRGLKETYKISFIVFAMWIIHIIDWSIDNFADGANYDVQRFGDIMKIIYSLQGLILFLGNFFYRSTRDPNPVLLQLTKLSTQKPKETNLNI